MSLFDRGGPIVLGTSLVLATSLAFVSPALGQSKEELNKARLEFQEGVALAAANNCPAALTKFRSVARVKNTPQVSFNVAECEERMGKLASALGDYRVAASAAASDPTAEIYAKVGERVTALEARVPKITVTRGKGAESATIELDGTALGDAQLGTEIPVDPGPHVVVGRIGDKEYVHETVTLAEKEGKTFDVTMSVPAPRLDHPDTDTPPVDDAAAKPRSRTPGIALASAGGGSMILGIVFIVMRGGTISDLDVLCGAGNTSCPSSVKTQGQSLVDKGRTYTGLAEVTLGLGSVALVTGLVLAATAGPQKPKTELSPAALWSPSKRVSFEASAPGASVGGASLVVRF